jgi:hypothetical protein
METYLDYTNEEDVAVLVIVLEELNIKHKVTSFANHGYVLARVEITPASNPIQQGYDIRSHVETIEALVMNDESYKRRFEKIIAEIKHLFEIEVPENQWKQVNGMWSIEEPEVNLFMVGDDIPEDVLKREQEEFDRQTKHFRQELN